jgi:hypothetical protein
MFVRRLADIAWRGSTHYSRAQGPPSATRAQLQEERERSRIRRSRPLSWKSTSVRRQCQRISPRTNVSGSLYAHLACLVPLLVNSLTNGVPGIIPPPE